MAARQYTISFRNQSGSTLTLLSKNLCGGEWTGGQAPPNSIPTGQSVAIGSQSDGTATGTEGYVIYVAGDGTQLYIYWDNPFIGTTRAASLVSNVDIESNFLQGNCSASYPSGGSTFSATPAFEVVPASEWEFNSGNAQIDLSYIYPVTSGALEAGLAWEQFAASAIPVYGLYEFIGSFFGDVGNMPAAENYFVFSSTPASLGPMASLRKFLHDCGADLSRGLRELAMKPPNNHIGPTAAPPSNQAISLRTMMLGTVADIIV